MNLVLSDLGPSHPLIKAANALAENYHSHPSMLKAINAVEHNFPQIDRYDFIVMWLAMNAFHHKKEESDQAE